MTESVLRRPSFTADQNLNAEGADDQNLGPKEFSPNTSSGPHLAGGRETLGFVRLKPIPSLGQTGATQAAERKIARKTLFTGLALLVALFAAAAACAHYFMVGRFIYSTDDAYVRTDLAIISPKISGYVEDVAVTDNQHVVAGQLLARLDAGDYRLALDAARGRIQTQDATIGRIEDQARAQQAVIAQAQAQLDAAHAELARAEGELARVHSLANSQFASRQRLDAVQAEHDKAVAAQAGAEAALAGASANLAVLRAQKDEAVHARAEMAVAEQRAQRDLDFAEIRAPFAGTVGNRAVERGQFAQPGTRLMALAPDNGAYVEANFKETQLDRLAPGQSALLRVDAFGGRSFAGVVESIAPASGAQFSLLPPENATGNFTKITQRFPVRIRVAPEDRSALRAGLSVVVDVDTRQD